MAGPPRLADPLAEPGMGARALDVSASWQPILKAPGDVARANLTDYDQAVAGFSWEAARALLDGLPGGGLNIAHEAVDRHVAHGLGGKVALRWIGQDGSIQAFTYDDLRLRTNRFANLLRGLGLGKGDRVYSLLGRRPELYVAAFGTLKAGCVFCPCSRPSARSRSGRGWRSARRPS